MNEDMKLQALNVKALSLNAFNEGLELISGMVL